MAATHGEGKGPLILIATETSRQSLEACSAVRSLTKDSWAENRLIDFNLWAAGVGATAKSSASLDWRLESQPEARIVVLNLLSTFCVFLEECRKLGSQSNLGQSSSPVLGASEPEEVRVGEDEPEEEGEDLAANIFPSWSDSSSSDSEIEDQEILTPGDLLSTAKNDAEVILDQLIDLGKKIRSSGMASRLRRADELFSPADYGGLRRHLITLLLTRPDKIEARRHLLDGNNGKRSTVVLDFDENEIDSQRWNSIEHLISANLRRRHRFTYARSHARKLAIRNDVNNLQEQVSREEAEGSAEGHDQPSKQGSPLEPRGTEIRKPNVAKNCKAQNDTTVASVLDPEVKIVNDSKPSGFTASRASMSLSRLHYPKPPRICKGIRSFRCPCCFQTLPVWESESIQWSKHLSQDVCPYTCIFPDCPAETPLFTTRESWKQHIRQDHQTSPYWQCLPCSSSETSKLFDTLENFKDHTRSSHGDSISNAQLELLERVCKKSNPVCIKACPLCIYGEDELPKDPDALLDHIGDHIHEFSLLSLPWADASELVDEETINATKAKVLKWLPDFMMDVATIPAPEQYSEVTSLDQAPQELFPETDYFAETSGESSRALSDDAFSDTNDDSDADHAFDIDSKSEENGQENIKKNPSEDLNEGNKSAGTSEERKSESLTSIVGRYAGPVSTHFDIGDRAAIAQPGEPRMIVTVVSARINHSKNRWEYQLLNSLNRPVEDEKWFEEHRLSQLNQGEVGQDGWPGKAARKEGSPAKSGITGTEQ